MHEFDGKALIFMIFNNDAIKKELSGLLDTSRQARRHHLIFLLKITLAMFLILCFAGFAIGIGFVRGAIDAAPSLDILDVQPQELRYMPCLCTEQWESFSQKVDLIISLLLDGE